ncbi:hypothetical protein ABT327_29170 [Streptomyces pilosus]
MDVRQVINGMVYKIRTRFSWRDLPERYGVHPLLSLRPGRCVLEAGRPRHGPS